MLTRKISFGTVLELHPTPNHLRENGNKFSSLLGWLSLVNPYLFCQMDPTFTRQHCGNSLWERVVIVEL